MSMKKYTATEMRVQAAQFKNDVRADPVLVKYRRNNKDFDLDAIMMNREHYKALLQTIEQLQEKVNKFGEGR